LNTPLWHLSDKILFSKFVLQRKRFNVIRVNWISKVCLNSFSLVLNIPQIFCSKIRKEKGKVKEKKYMMSLVEEAQNLSTAAL
jgi:hypothetical protein